MLDTFLRAPVYDQHTKSNTAITPTQLTIFIIWLTTTLLWILRQIRFKSRSHRIRRQVVTCAECSPSLIPNGDYTTEEKVSTDGVTSPANKSIAAVSIANGKCVEIDGTSAMTSRNQCSSGITPMTLDANHQVDSGTFSPATLPPWAVDDCLKQIVLLGGLMIYFYLCDYIKVYQ